MKKVAYVAVAVAFCGCAATRPVSAPPRDLMLARYALEQAEKSPGASSAGAALDDARRALAEAEQAAARSPTDPVVVDLSYEALRKAERARVEGLHAVELEALGTARQRVERIRGHLERRAAMEEERARRAAEEETARKPRRDALAKALDGCRGELGNIRAGQNDEEASEVVLRLPAAVLFRPGTTVLLPDAEKRIDDIVHAVDQGPPSRILIRSMANSDGYQAMSRVDAGRLAQTRGELLRDELLRRGVPLDSIEIQAGRAGDASVEFAVIERPYVPPPPSVNDRLP